MKQLLSISALYLLFLTAFGQDQYEYDELSFKKGIYHVTESVDGKSIFVGTEKGQSIEVNEETSEIINSFQVEKKLILAQAVSPNLHFLVTGDQNGIVNVWNRITKTAKQLMSSEQAITSLLFNHNGKILLVASADGIITVWDIYQNKKLATLNGHKGAVTSMSLNPSESRLISGSYDGSIIIWDLRSFKKLNTMPMEGKKVRSVAYSHGGKYFAVGLENKIARIFNTKNYTPTGTFRGHKSLVYQVAFSYDDKQLITGSQDNTVRIWNIEDMKELKRFPHIASFVNFKLSNDAKTIYIADMTPDLKAWNITNLNLTPNKRKAYKTDVLTEKSSVSFNVDKTRPKISLVQPRYTKPNQKFILHLEDDKENLIGMTVKGNVKSKNDIHKLYINNTEIGLDNGKFSHHMKLAFGNNTIKVRAIDIYGNESSSSVMIQQQYRVEGFNDTLSRYGRDYALIIATNDYKNYTDLRNPVFDGRTIARELSTIYGFEIDTLFDPTKEEIVKKLNEYKEKQYADDDQLLIFYAGHGDYDGEAAEGYLVPKNAAKIEDDMFKEFFISHTYFREQLNQITSKHVFLVLDACFGGTFDKKLVEASRGISSTKDDRKKFIQSRMRYKTRRYVSSGGKEYVPDGRPGEHSPFAKMFIEALLSGGGSRGILTIAKILSYVEEVDPMPQDGEFGDNELRSEFLFIKK